MFANDYIRTADLLNRERLLYQLSHNHCPRLLILQTTLKRKY